MTAPALQLEPKRELSRFVESYRVVPDGAAVDAYVRLPDGHMDLVVRFTSTFSGVYAVGTRLSALRKPSEQVPPRTLIVRFKPGGAYPFFGVPLSELTNRVVSLDTLWGPDGGRLRERLAEAPSVTVRRHLVEEALLERLRGSDVFEPPSAYLVRRAVRLVSEARELPRVEGLARGLGISTRQLRRAFEDVVGVGPKEFTRLVRFQRAVRAWRHATEPDWGAIAAATGYYDQSHLITDFKALTGATPREFLGRRSRSVRPRGAA
ncbi:helix-turn-helix domain-containing protein [Pyxidicoccus fallax]|uniref:helix-turn-helix domain-containing protein n=1 Tax=Pyxidicoccus fallax TaxID=394095 RepID=UPI0031B579A7